MSKVQVIMTEDSIVLSNTDGNVYQLHKDNGLFDKVVGLFNDREFDQIATILDVPARIRSYAKGAFAIVNGQLYARGRPIPAGLSTKVLQFCDNDIDPSPLLRFWDNLENNPSKDTQEDLFAFLEHNGVSVTNDGCFVCYRRVTDDFKDFYTGKIDNSVGAVVDMDREKVDSNKHNTCSSGLHAAAYHYAKDRYHAGSGKLVEVKINPVDVVCIPPYYSQEKMRVCKYEVVRECTKEYTSPLYAHDNSADDSNYDDYDGEAVDPGDWCEWDVTSEDGIEEDTVVSGDEDAVENLTMTLTPDFRNRVRIPKVFIDALKLKAGDKVTVVSEGNNIEVMPSVTFNEFSAPDPVFGPDEVAKEYVVDSYGNVRFSLANFERFNARKPKTVKVSIRPMIGEFALLIV